MTLKSERHIRAQRLHEAIHPTFRTRHAWDWTQDIERMGRLERYNREDEMLDQLGQLPSKEFVRLFISKLRHPELQEFTEGVVNDVTDAIKKGDNLESAKAINSWIATAEEPISSRRKIRHVLAARARGHASS